MMDNDESILDGDKILSEDKNVRFKEWNWKDIISNLLTEESPLTKRRLQIRTCDVVFLEGGKRPNLEAWYFTSKQGYIVRRCLSSRSTGSAEKYRGNKSNLVALNLHHVYERFCRIALVGKKGRANICKTIAALHCWNSEWDGIEKPSFLSAKALNDLTTSTIGHASLHSFHDDADDKNRRYRVIVTHAMKETNQDSDSSLPSYQRLVKARSRDFMTKTFVIYDFSSFPKIAPIVDCDNTLPDSLLEEITEAAVSIAQHVDAILSDNASQDIEDITFLRPKVHILVADFALDCKKLLWLTHIPKLITYRSRMNHYVEKRLAQKARSQIKKLFEFNCASDKGDGTLNNENNKPIADWEYTNVKKGSNMIKKIKELKSVNKNGALSVGKDSDGTITDVTETKESKIIQILRDRIISLQADVASEESKAKQATDAANDAASQVRQMKQKLLLVQRESQKSFEQIDAEHRASILRISSQLSESKAEIVRLKSNASSGETNVGQDNHNTKPYTQEDILLKINELHQELEASHRKWAEEKRTLASSQAAIEQSQAAEYRKVLCDHRHEVSKLEDQIEAHREKVRILEKDKILLTQKYTEVESIKQKLHVELEQLRVETIPGAQKFCNPESNNHCRENRCCSPNSESIVRSLTNKVEYLKAQLLSEATLKDEYVDLIERLRSDKETIAVSAKAKLRALQVAKDNEISKLEEKMHICLEAPSQEILQLKSKIVSLQIKVDEANENTSLANRRGKDAIESLAKEKAKIAILYEDLSNAKAEAEAACDEAKRLKESQNLSADEAMIRRLDNERTYLRNQLENEVLAKNSLQELIKSMGRENQEKEQNHTRKMEEMKCLIQKIRVEKSELEAKSSSVREALGAELKLKYEELNEIKEAYIKNRDELRIERATAEQVRSASKRLAQELQAAHDEIKQASVTAQEMKQRHANNLQAISASIKKTEDNHTKETNDLQNELHLALRDLGKTQRELFDMQTQMITQKNENKKGESVRNLASSLSSAYRLSMTRSFCKWYLFICASRIRCDYMESVERAVKLTEERVKEEQNSLSKSLIEQMIKEHDSHLSSVRAQFSDDRRRLEEQAKVNIQQVNEEGNKRLVKILEDKKLEWSKKEHNLQNQHIAMMEKQADVNRCHIGRMNLKFKETLEAKIKEMEQSFADRYKILSLDYQKQLEKSLNEAENKSKSDLNKSLTALSEKHEDNLKQIRCKYEDEKKELQCNHEKEVEAIRNDERAKAVKGNENAIAEALKNATLNFESKLKQQQDIFEQTKHQLSSDHENNLKDMHRRKEEEMMGKVDNIRFMIEEDSRRKMNSELETIQHNYEQLIQQEVEKQEKLIDDFKQQLVIVKRNAFEEGHKSAHSMKKEEIVKLKLTASETLEKVKSKAEETIRIALKESEKKIEEAKSYYESERTIALKDMKNSAALEIERLKNEYESQKNKALAEYRYSSDKACEDKVKKSVEEAVKLEQEVFCRLQMEFKAEKRKWKEECKHLIQVNKEIEMKFESQLKENTAAYNEEVSSAKKKYEEYLSVELKKQSDELYLKHNAEIENIMHVSEQTRRESIEKTTHDATQGYQNTLATLEKEFSNKIKEFERNCNAYEMTINELKCHIESYIKQIESVSKEKICIETSFEKRIKLLSMQFLAFIVHQKQNTDKSNKLLALKRSEYESVIEDTKSNHNRMKEDFETVVSSLREEIRHKNQQRKRIRTILRDSKHLIVEEFRDNCIQVTDELKIATNQKNVAEASLKSLESEADQIQQDLHDLEKQIQYHSQTSAIQDGRINMTHARKKRRLDEEFEALIDKMEVKRTEINQAESKVKETLTNREIVEAKLNNIESRIIDLFTKNHYQLLKVVEAG